MYVATYILAHYIMRQTMIFYYHHYYHTEQEQSFSWRIKIFVFFGIVHVLIVILA